jgi:hypothetical protein
LCSVACVGTIVPLTIVRADRRGDLVVGEPPLTFPVDRREFPRVLAAESASNPCGGQRGASVSLSVVSSVSASARRSERAERRTSLASRYARPLLRAIAATCRNSRTRRIRGERPTPPLDRWSPPSLPPRGGE